LSKEQKSRELLSIKAAQIASSPQGAVKMNVLGPGNGVVTISSSPRSIFAGDLLLGSETPSTPTSPRTSPRGGYPVSELALPQTGAVTASPSSNQLCIDTSVYSDSPRRMTMSEPEISSSLDGYELRQRQLADMIRHAAGNLSRYSVDLVHGKIMHFTCSKYR
jgi:hypothetical protein